MHLLHAFNYLRFRRVFTLKNRSDIYDDILLPPSNQSDEYHSSVHMEFTLTLWLKQLCMSLYNH